jgi:thymidine kinase
MSGRLEIYFGPMCSGKSSELIRLAHKYRAIDKKVIIFTYYKDTRYGINVVSSHDNIKLKAYPLELLSDISKDKNISDEYNDADLVIIEEGQFFKDLFDFVVNSVNVLNKFVVVGGLISDYKLDKFGQISDLIRYADNITHLTAFCKICNDGTVAPFTMRVSKSTDVELIGVDEYISVCRKHYLTIDI